MGVRSVEKVIPKPGWKISILTVSTGFRSGYDHKITQHPLLSHVTNRKILREFHSHGLHQRRASVRGNVRKGVIIRRQTVARKNIHTIRFNMTDPIRSCVPVVIKIHDMTANRNIKPSRIRKPLSEVLLSFIERQRLAIDAVAMKAADVRAVVINTRPAYLVMACNMCGE